MEKQLDEDLGNEDDAKRASSARSQKVSDFLIGLGIGFGYTVFWGVILLTYFNSIYWLLLL